MKERPCGNSEAPEVGITLWSSAEIALQADNVLNLPEGSYVALLSHSGSRGLGAAIAKHYSLLAREVCKLPREAQHFAWLSLDSEEGQEYWMSMNLAGDYARAVTSVFT